MILYTSDFQTNSNPECFHVFRWTISLKGNMYECVSIVWMWSLFHGMPGYYEFTSNEEHHLGYNLQNRLNIKLNYIIYFHSAVKTMILNNWYTMIVVSISKQNEEGRFAAHYGVSNIHTWCTYNGTNREYSFIERSAFIHGHYICLKLWFKNAIRTV